MLDHFVLTYGRFLGITTDNPSSNYSMTWELQSTLEATGIEWPALLNHIPYMAQVVQLAIGAVGSSLAVIGPTYSSESHDRDQQFAENEIMDIGNSQRLRNEGNARMNKVSPMKPGLAKINGKVRISWSVECPEVDLHIAENACWINYANTWSLKGVYWQSTS